MAFSIVHHIRVEKDEFVAAQHGKEDNKEHGEKDNKEHGEKDNKEHMFAFVEGLTTPEIGQLAELIHRWQDVVKDHCTENRSFVCFTYEPLLPPLFYSQDSSSTFYLVTQKIRRC